MYKIVILLSILMVSAYSLEAISGDKTPTSKAMKLQAKAKTEKQQIKDLKKEQKSLLKQIEAKNKMNKSKKVKRNNKKSPLQLNVSEEH